MLHKVIQLPEGHRLRRQKEWSPGLDMPYYKQARLARSRLQSLEVRSLFGTATDLKLPLRRHLRELEDAALGADSHRSARLLYEVKPTTRPWKHLDGGDRWASCQLARLRLGCSRLAADQHHRGLADSPTCQHCNNNVPETRDHYLLHCPRWRHERAELWGDLAQLEVRGLALPCDAPTLLGGMTATKNRALLESIARATGRFLESTGRLRETPKKETEQT